jgi:spermidine/putrescine-binding protein
MQNIEVTLEICTIYKGTPYGLAIIKYSHPDNNFLSFKGVGVFNQGKLTNSSFSYIGGDGFGYSYTKMENGRPVENSYATFFNPKGYKQNVFSTKN